MTNKNKYIITKKLGKGVNGIIDKVVYLDRSDMLKDSAEILSVPILILIKTVFSFFKSVKVYFADKQYKSALSATKSIRQIKIPFDDL